MMLVLTLLCRDEADILESMLRFHLAQGVDRIIATEPLSVAMIRSTPWARWKRNMLSRMSASSLQSSVSTSIILLPSLFVWA